MTADVCCDRSESWKRIMEVNHGSESWKRSVWQLTMSDNKSGHLAGDKSRGRWEIWDYWK